jgi:hypothetical protein
MITVLGLVILLWLLAGCNGNGPAPEFSMIETPSAVRQIQWGPPSHPDNLANYQMGFVRDSGVIAERPVLDGGTMWSYPREDRQGFIPDLRGTAVSIDLDDQWGSGVLGDNFHEMVTHLLVLEFTFPEATFQGQTEINWFVTPHLTCRYDIDSVESGDEAFLWFEYVVYEDHLGALDLLWENEDALWASLSQGLEDEQEYVFEGDVDGTLLASSDERSGTMLVDLGRRARLFVGISVLMRTHQQGDRIQLGGDSLPNSVSDSDRCTFHFGRNSYYTMRPAGND